ncbi:response regulator [Neorhodopirellula pilleata]|uniref:Response regulator receiver protein n=1 Tax=Neorhodopirellula pilleata TaxID=2714738 RepID=A0A5C6AQP2_9BACT|nr:response regulator [Neorhodopirellula pilleata]TWU01878.1 Response regulator receiver protein [Neorhodopirellula pilleata]
MNQETTRVLVVDDDGDIRQNVRDILEDLGYEVDIAPDGATALNLAKTVDYDIALLDYLMPGMNGVELYQQLRRLQPELVAIMITAFAGDDGVEAAYDSGAWKVLRKPVDIRSLIPMMDEALQKPIVLVVDDDEEFCDNLWQTLRHHDYRVNLARSEDEGIRKAHQSTYSTAIVDLKLGGGDGRKVIDLIRRLRPDVRVVVVTGYQRSPENLEDEVGSFCFKPIDMKKLLSLISPP